MNARRFFKRSVSIFLIPITRWYLRKERMHQYKGITVKVMPGVFHPGLFPSTKFLLRYLEKQNLKGKTLLELGCGSGLISLVTYKQGALVTACDLNEKAVLNCKGNAELNEIKLKVFHSDLFESIPSQLFDWIVINPPYYAKPARTEEELAWNCGENYEYFKKLFSSLKSRTHDQTKTIMILTLGCGIATIKKIANENGLVLDLIEEQNVLFDEKDFIFQIKPLK